MKLKLRLLTIAASLGFGAFLASCESTGTAVAGGDAVMCDKCKTVWIKQPVGIGGPGGRNFVQYKDAKTMTCPEGTSAATGFFKTGQLKHSCSHCGGTLTHCTAH